MKTIVLLICVIIICTAEGLAQDQSAIIQFDSEEKGLLIPRMDSLERVSIVNPAAGLMVYDSSMQAFFFYNGSSWKSLRAEPQSPAMEWGIQGNSGTNDATNFVGTTDNQDLVLKSGNNEIMRVDDTTGYIGVNGQNDPYTILVSGAGQVTNDFAWDGSAEEAIVVAPASGGAGLVLSSQAINRIVFDATLAPINHKLFSLEHFTDLSSDSWLALNSFNDNGTSKMANILSLSHATGNVGLGGNTFGSNAQTVLGLFNGIAPTTTTSNSVQLWAADVAGSSELHVMDEAGNTTVLSPHNFSGIPAGSSEPMAWSFYSENKSRNEYINVDMLKAIRQIEQLSGEKLVYINNLDEVKEKKSLSNDVASTVQEIGQIERLKNEVEELKELIQELMNKIEVEE